MATYEYRCRQCGAERSVVASIADGPPGIMCVECGAPGRMGRRFSFTPAEVVHTMFDLSTQKATTAREHRDNLKRAAEEQFIRTGIPSDPKPVDLRDSEACGITSEDKDRLRREYVDTGRRLPPALKE